MKQTSKGYIKFLIKYTILRTFLKEGMQKYVLRDRCSCPNDMNHSALERGGLGASFERDNRFIGGLDVAVSSFKLNGCI